MSIWALLSLTAGILHLMLGIYVFFTRPKSAMNRLFALYALSLMIWCLTEFAHKLHISPETADIFLKAGGFGWSVMASFCTHFILIFARREKILKSIFTEVRQHNATFCT